MKENVVLALLQGCDFVMLAKALTQLGENDLLRIFALAYRDEPIINEDQLLPLFEDPRLCNLVLQGQKGYVIGAISIRITAIEPIDFYQRFRIRAVCKKYKYHKTEEDANQGIAGVHTQDDTYKYPSEVNLEISKTVSIEEIEKLYNQSF